METIRNLSKLMTVKQINKLCKTVKVTSLEVLSNRIVGSLYCNDYTDKSDVDLVFTVEEVLGFVKKINHLPSDISYGNEKYLYDVGEFYIDDIKVNIIVVNDSLLLDEYSRMFDEAISLGLNKEQRHLYFDLNKSARFHQRFIGANKKAWDTYFREGEK